VAIYCHVCFCCGWLVDSKHPVSGNETHFEDKGSHGAQLQWNKMTKKTVSCGLACSFTSGRVFFLLLLLLLWKSRMVGWNLAISWAFQKWRCPKSSFWARKISCVNGIERLLTFGLRSFWGMLQVLGLTTTWTHESLSRCKSLVSTVAMCLASGKPEGFLSLESGSEVSHHFFSPWKFRGKHRLTTFFSKHFKNDLYISSLKLYNSLHLKIRFPQRKVVFQPSIFDG